MSRESKLEFVTICSQATVDKLRGGRESLGRLFGAQVMTGQQLLREIFPEKNPCAFVSTGPRRAA